MNNNYYDFHSTRLHRQWLREKTPADLLPFMEMLELRARVLDLGCGNGVDLAWLSKAGHSGVGVDSSPQMVSFARELHVRSGIEILEKNFLFLSLAESEFDGVWANLSFPHLAPEELQRLLAICFKGMKVGGAFGAVLYEGEGSFEDRGDDGNVDGPSRKVYLYTEKQLCSLFEQTGYQIKKVGRQLTAGDRLPKILILAVRV